MNNLLDFLKNTEELKKLQELNDYFYQNRELYDKIELMKELQRKYIVSKSKGDLEVASIAKKNYEDMVSEIIDYPFVEEYFDLLNLFHNTLELIEKEMEKELLTIF